jgi:hypothetical protein
MSKLPLLFMLAANAHAVLIYKLPTPTASIRFDYCSGFMTAKTGSSCITLYRSEDYTFSPLRAEARPVV